MSTDVLYTGLLPNVYHQALSFEQLRQSDAFQALPPVESICIAGAPSYRYIRQDDPLWGRLHTGRLTSGFIAAALGLFEPTAASQLKLGKSRASHGPLLAVYNHLLQPPYEPSTNPHITEESAAQHNAQVMEAFNSEPNDQGPRSGEALLSREEIQAELAPRQQEQQPHHRGGKKKKGRRRKGPSKSANAPLVHIACNISYGSSDVPIGSVTEEMKLKKARALSGQGLEAVRCAWGKAQEAPALQVLAAVFPESCVREVGLCMLDQNKISKDSVALVQGGGRSGEEYKNAQGLGGIEALSGCDLMQLPLIGASPDALIFHPHGALPALNAEVAPNDGSVLAAGEGNHAEKIQDGVLEVVEVKNSCPFDYSQQRGRSKRKFVVCDRGPRQNVEPLWVPQIQLHMLCTGAKSGLIVSRSATRGVRLFRVAADPELQRLMLCTLSKLWTKHVVPGKPPPRDVFKDDRDHHELVKRIRGAVSGAKVVGDVEQAVAGGALRGRDQRFFLD